WELLLYNQFHDVLPGSSIGPVYVDSEADQRRIERLADDAFAAAAGQLAAPEGQSRGADAAAGTERASEDLGGPLLLNSLSWARGGVLELPWREQLANAAALDDDGEPLPAQTVGEGDGRVR